MSSNGSNDRCGFIFKPKDVPVDIPEYLEKFDSQEWHEWTRAVCCWREPQVGHDQCIWHIDIDNKLAEEIADQNIEKDWRVDGAILRNCELDNKIDFAEKWIQGADLSKARLLGADFNNAIIRFTSFSDASLQKANLSDAFFQETDFTNAKLQKANLTNTTFDKVDLSNTDFRGANLTDVDFRSADLTDADFRGSDLTNVDLHGADLTNAELRGTDLTNVALYNADLTNADLRGTDLTNVNLYNTDLTNADLHNADLTGADLRNTNLNEVNLHRSNLTNVELANADITNGFLQEAELVDANLSRADLTNANLTNANLSSAKFQDAILEDVKLTGADISDGVLINADLSDMSLRDVNFTNADLQYADLSNTDLTEAKLSGANGIGINATGCNAQRAEFDNAALQQAEFTDSILHGSSFESANLRSGILDRADCRSVSFQNAVIENGWFTETDLRGADFSGALLYNTDLGDGVVNSNTNILDFGAYDQIKERDYPIEESIGISEQAKRQRWTYRMFRQVLLDNGRVFEPRSHTQLHLAEQRNRLSGLELWGKQLSGIGDNLPLDRIPTPTELAIRIVNRPSGILKTVFILSLPFWIFYLTSGIYDPTTSTVYATSAANEIGDWISISLITFIFSVISLLEGSADVVTAFISLFVDPGPFDEVGWRIKYLLGVARLEPQETASSIVPLQRLLGTFLFVPIVLLGIYRMNLYRQLGSGAAVHSGFIGWLLGR